MGVRKILQRNFAKKKFFLKKFFFPVLTCIKPNLVSKFFPFTGGGGMGWGGGGGGVTPGKVAQNELKQILVLEFLRSDDFQRGGGSLCEIQTDVQLDTRHSDQISRSARRDGATKKYTIFFHVLSASVAKHLWCYWSRFDAMCVGHDFNMLFYGVCSISVLHVQINEN